MPRMGHQLPETSWHLLDGPIMSHTPPDSASPRPSLAIELLAGHPEVSLDGTLLPIGTEVELERGGRWFRAWIVEDAFMATPCVRIIDPRWPGAPLTVSVANLSLVPARPA